MDGEGPREGLPLAIHNWWLLEKSQFSSEMWFLRAHLCSSMTLHIMAAFSGPSGFFVLSLRVYKFGKELRANRNKLKMKELGRLIKTHSRHIWNPQTIKKACYVNIWSSHICSYECAQICVLTFIRARAYTQIPHTHAKDKKLYK